jgi:hypothetical protein
MQAERLNAYRILVGMPEGKGPLGRPRRGQVNSIKMDRGERLEWCGLSMAGVITVMSHRVT